MTDKPEEKETPVFDTAAQDALMDALLEAIIVVDSEGIIERFNKSAEEMFGYTAAEAIGQNVNILMPGTDHDQHDNYIQRFISTRNAKIIGKGREVTALRRDGTQFPIHLAVGEVGWRGSVRFIGMMRDLTDTKLAEERTLRQHTDMISASRLTTMGEMAAAMAHEINQPLAAIANYASAGLRLLEADPDNLQDTKTALQGIDAQAHRAGDIIRRLRNFVTPETFSYEPVNLKTIVDEVRPLAELDAHANNIALEVNISEDLPEIVADQLQIQQVILNLVRNGIDAMSDARPEDRQIKLIGYQLSADSLAVDVIDRGHGIPDEVGRNLFTPFFSTKSAGMGMGLAISQTIIKAHAGELNFENNPDKGAKFSIKLPTRVT